MTCLHRKVKHYLCLSVPDCKHPSRNVDLQKNKLRVIKTLYCLGLIYNYLLSFKFMAFYLHLNNCNSFYPFSYETKTKDRAVLLL